MSRRQLFSLGLQIISAPLLIALGFFVFLNLHESFHVLAARLMGDSAAYYILYESYPNGNYAIGRAITSVDFEGWAMIFIALSAPVMTRVMAEGVQWIKRRGWTRPVVFWWALYVCFRLDFAGYVVRNFIGDVFYGQHPSGQDISEPIHILANGDDTVRMILWALFIVVAFGDILLDRKRIIGFFRRGSKVQRVQPIRQELESVAV